MEGDRTAESVPGSGLCSGSWPLAHSWGPAGHRLHGAGGRQHCQCRAALDPDRAGCQPIRYSVGALRICADLRHRARGRRARRRYLRPGPDFHSRVGDLYPLVDRRRPGPRCFHPEHCPVHPGHRLRPAQPAGDRNDPAVLPGRRAGPGFRPDGHGHWCLGCHRAIAGGFAGPDFRCGARLALDVPGQRSRGHPGLDSGLPLVPEADA